MRREESWHPKDWFRIGDRELRRAQNLLRLGDLKEKRKIISKGLVLPLVRCLPLGEFVFLLIP